MPKDRIWELVAKKLSGEASTEELQEIETQMRLNPDLHYPMQTLTDLWHRKAKPEENSYEAFDRHTLRMRSLEFGYPSVTPYEEPVNDENPRHFQIENTSKNRKAKYFPFPVLLFLLMVIAGISLYRFLSPSEPLLPKQTAEKSEVSTKYGSKTKLVLPDGSQVWLNSGSKLTYDGNYGKGIREVGLTGEAYFDVIKNPSLPFIIHSSKINIRVLGTAFNVKSYPGEKNIEASLVRGSIEVTLKDRPNEKIILRPNEKLVIATEEETITDKPAKKNVPSHIALRPEPIVSISHLSYQPMDSTIIETSWLENKLIFRSEAFVELAVRMERWYGVKIRFSDEGIKRKRLTGIFENETIEQALVALQFIAPFKYSFTKNEIIISK